MHYIELKGVSKHFKRNKVLDKTDIRFESGRIYGLVGENGCGKTVLMKLIIGLMRPSEGSVEYDDAVLKRDFDYLPSVGFVIETPGFFEELSGVENLKLLAGINGKIDEAEIMRWLEIVGLPADDKPVSDYSLGMNQRLGIAQALMEDPEVIILDEPTNSLDDEGVDLIYRLLREEKEKDKIIIISSHSKHDIETLCDEVYRIKNGGVYLEEKKQI